MTAEAQRVSKGSNLAGARVLVVEDDTIIALELEQVVRQLGCTVLGTCGSVAAALAALQRERPDAALLDVGLPDGPATPVAEALAAAGVPFALITGYDVDALLDASFAGVPVLTKPFTLEALERTVVGLLGSGRNGRPGRG